MKRSYQVAIVAASIALGVAFGWGVLTLFGTPLVQHFPWGLLGEKEGGAGIILPIFNMGIIFGVLMTLAVLGGLAAGVALAQRVSKPSHLPELRAA